MNSIRGSSWRWWISGLLLLATMINYMDRQTLANLSVRITDEFQLTGEQYGTIESVFGVAFAIGSIVFGILADRFSVYFVYPFVLVAWSAVGFATGLTSGYESMLVCRGLLGFFEAGHWPCALIVTQSIMVSGDRVMGNSVLQSGASLGAITTPLIIRSIVGDNMTPGAWRLPFLIVGTVGLGWAVLWFLMIRKEDFAIRNQSTPDGERRTDSGWLDLRWVGEFLINPRFWALTFMVISINTSWQLIRAWLPKFLQQGRGYSEAEALYFNSVYYVSTDIGCIGAGAAGLWLVKRGLQVHHSRIAVFAICAVLSALTVVAALLPHGWILLGTLLIVGAGTLGLFPCYYSLTQEVTDKDIGKLAGLLSSLGWLASAPMQTLFGRSYDQTGSYDLGFALAGCLPCIGLLFFMMLWPRKSSVDSRLADY